MAVEFQLDTEGSQILADIPVMEGYRAGISLSQAGSLVFRVDNYLQSRAGFLSQFGVRGVLFGSRQVNSLQVVVVDDRPPRSIGAVLADAMVTDRSDAVLTLIVADCLPIYLVDTASGAFGLVHSGWKGTGIVMEAIRTMASLYGTLAADIEVTIGHRDRSLLLPSADRERAALSGTVWAGHGHLG